MKRPINELFESSLENVGVLMDASKIVGNPIKIDESTIIIPISKITMGFGIGGSEFKSKEDKKNEQSKEVAYVAYSDKGIVEEFYEGTTLANAFNILVKKYGIDAVRTNKIKLFELNQIKPKIKETINYELDM